MPQLLEGHGAKATRLAFGVPMAESIHIYIPSLDEGAMEQAAARQGRLTKPAGSLCRLEELSINPAGLTRRLDPPLANPIVFTLPAAHRAAAHGGQAYPPHL